MFGSKKADSDILSSINFEFSNSEIIVSKDPGHYGNDYLWKSILHDVLLEFTNNAQITVDFFDEQMYDIFTFLVGNNLITSANNDTKQVVINSCNKRIVAELMSGYSFFDYSDIFTIIIYDITGERICCISPVGDDLGVRITHFNNFSLFEAIVEKICNDYNVNMKRKKYF